MKPCNAIHDSIKAMEMNPRLIRGTSSRSVHFVHFCNQGHNICLFSKKGVLKSFLIKTMVILDDATVIF